MAIPVRPAVDRLARFDHRDTFTDSLLEQNDIAFLVSASFFRSAPETPVDGGIVVAGSGTPSHPGSNRACELDLQASRRFGSGSAALRAPPGLRLVLADVDGTLVTQDKVVTEATRAAVRELRAAGLAVAITSGRPPRGMRMLIEPLGLVDPIAGFNGGMLVNPDLSVIESHALDPEIAERAVTLMLKQGLDVWVYTESEWLIRDPSAPRVARESSTVRFDPRVVSEFTAEHLTRAMKLVGTSEDLPLVAACEKTVRERLGGGASAARSQPYYLDVTHPQANKGEVVRTLARHFNIEPAQIVTVGDMPSDVAMFRVSGFSIAMGNASDEVKKEADVVTGSNQEEGFADAVRRFLLPRNVS